MTNVVAIGAGQTWVAWQVQQNNRLLRAIRFSAPRAVKCIHIGQWLCAVRADSSLHRCAAPGVDVLPVLVTLWVPRGEPRVLMAGIQVSIDIEPAEACTVEFEHDARGGFNARA